LIVDDHPVVRAGLVDFIAKDSRFRVLGDAPNADVAQTLAIDLRPQLVLMDINMPGTQSVSVVQLWSLTWSSLRVVMCSSHSDLNHVRALTTAGAWGYILKEEYPETYLQGLAAVASGERWLSPTLRARLGANLPECLASMSAWEGRVLVELGQGRTLPEIAASLQTDVPTVNGYLSSLMGRLKVRSSAEVATEGLLYASALQAL
jgi:DNA-binding NarL/FixJ family response regulator